MNTSHSNEVAQSTSDLVANITGEYIQSRRAKDHPSIDFYIFTVSGLSVSDDIERKSSFYVKVVVDENDIFPKLKPAKTESRAM